MTPTRVVAVDWSGRQGAAARRAIWSAEVRDGVVTRLEDGRTREEVVDHLVELAADEDLFVGLDFSFSLPAWFLAELGLGAAPELWAVSEAQREAWLRCDAPPFWGRKGRRRPDLPEHLRGTERAAAVGPIRPKSTFQVSGAGSVGAGSLRGFPALAALRTQGFSVWPFDDARPPVVFEVWPRLLTGPVVKSNLSARAEYLERLDRDAPRSVDLLPRWARERATGDEHAFDALVSALVMADHTEELRALRRVDDPVVSLEGAMWAPDAATAGVAGEGAGIASGSSSTRTHPSPGT